MFINCQKAITFFENLHIGDVFYSEYDSDYCMKMYQVESENEVYNAVSLSKGMPTLFADNDTVERIQGEFVVK